MLRTVNGQPTLWEAVLPECRLPLPGDLGRVDDEWLDDPRFFEPFRPFFDPTRRAALVGDDIEIVGEATDAATAVELTTTLEPTSS